MVWLLPDYMVTYGPIRFKDANQWHVVNLRTIGGQIRHEKGSLKCIGLVFLGMLRVKQKVTGKVK